MPFVAGPDGVRTYYEVDGEGPPLLLLHGFAGGAERWRGAGYIEALRRDFRVIVVDARGHGQSDKPHDADAYSPQAVVGDVVAVLDDVGAEAAHVWGYSAGGGVTELLYEHAPARMSSAVIGGWARRQRGPLSESPEYRALQAGIEAYVGLMGAILTQEARAYFLRNDAEALVACLEGFARWPEVPSAPKCPTLVYAGDADPTHERAETFAAGLPSARFISLAKANHGTAFANSAAILPDVRTFLKAAAGSSPRI